MPFLYIAFAFFLFWSQGGWERVDCALGIALACEYAERDSGAYPKRKVN